MCIDPHQTGFVGKGSDHLQLIRFWPSLAPGLHCSRAKIFGSALLQPAHSVCVPLSAFSFLIETNALPLCQTAIRSSAKSSAGKCNHFISSHYSLVNLWYWLARVLTVTVHNHEIGMKYHLRHECEEHCSPMVSSRTDQKVE